MNPAANNPDVPLDAGVTLTTETPTATEPAHPSDLDPWVAALHELDLIRLHANRLGRLSLLPRDRVEGLGQHAGTLRELALRQLRAIGAHLEATSSGRGPDSTPAQPGAPPGQ